MNRKQLTIGRIGCCFGLFFSLIRSFVFGFAGHSNAWFGVLEVPFFVALFGLLLYGLHKVSHKFSSAGVIISLLNAVFLFVHNISLYEDGWMDLLDLFMFIGPFIYFVLIWLSIPSFQVKITN